MQLARRAGLSLVVVVVLALVAVGILAISTVRRSFPQTAGELRVEGALAAVRDAASASLEPVAVDEMVPA